MEAYTVINGYSSYEIANEYPHVIRRRDNQQVVSEWLNTNGYYRLNLVNDNGERKKEYKHVIVASTFIHNDDPVNKTFVDHLNHDKTDNHISNLRWCSPRENAINRSSSKGVNYDFITELPHGCVKVTHYNNHEFNDIYYHVDTDVFYKKMTDHFFRIMHHTIAPSGNRYVQTMSMLNKKVSIYNHVVARDIDIYPEVNEEGDDTEQ